MLVFQWPKWRIQGYTTVKWKGKKLSEKAANFVVLIGNANTAGCLNPRLLKGTAHNELFTVNSITTAWIKPTWQQISVEATLKQWYVNIVNFLYSLYKTSFLFHRIKFSKWRYGMIKMLLLSITVFCSSRTEKLSFKEINLTALSAIA